ncbi:uncharacterized protein LOC124166425 [Ischnura elegans]|uniref:uncharacterized protein LOC124166425 n=1 Tax=Ischnura elegans TaxID=197161 RepID=UPI001ED8BF64|nr:uncharacterized protein LOC124166425 [Ischnura elegans]
MQDERWKVVAGVMDKPNECWCIFYLLIVVIVYLLFQVEILTPYCDRLSGDKKTAHRKKPRLTLSLRRKRARTPPPTSENVKVINLESDESDCEENVLRKERGSSPQEKTFPPSFWSPKRLTEEFSRHRDDSLSAPQTPDSPENVKVINLESDESDCEENVLRKERGSSPQEKTFPPSFWSPKRLTEEFSRHRDDSLSAPQTPDSQASTVVIDWENEVYDTKSDKVNDNSENNKHVDSRVSDENAYSDISECTTLPSLPEEWCYDDDIWDDVMANFVCTCDSCINRVYCAMIGEIPDYLNI